MNKITQHQGGWVVGFVIVGVLLFAGLLASILFVKGNYGNDPSIADSESSEQQASDKTNTSDSGSNKDDTKNSETATGSDTNDASSPSTKEPSSEKAKAEDSNVSANNEGTKSSGSNSEKLPETGPGGVLATFMAVSLMSFSGILYVRSLNA